VGVRPVAYLDNPAGTQVPRHVGQAMLEYFAQANANSHGPFLTSQRTDAIVDRSRLLAARCSARSLPLRSCSEPT
jgi:selenocysteine lyase/cysteine desulfurase